MGEWAGTIEAVDFEDRRQLYEAMRHSVDTNRRFPFFKSHSNILKLLIFLSAPFSINDAHVTVNVW